MWFYFLIGNLMIDEFHLLKNIENIAVRLASPPSMAK
jgi:hypothetical protein